MWLKRQIPNLFTISNLALGVVAIQLASMYHFQSVAYCIFVAAIFDYLDGYLARKLNASSHFGKELDSLADMVSFGLAPSVLLLNLAYDKAYVFQTWSDGDDNGLELYTVFFACICIAIFSAIRLAKFNVTAQSAYFFRGLTTPANALVIASLPFIFEYTIRNTRIDTLVINSYTVIGFSAVQCFLLVTNIPMLSMKFKHFNPKDYVIHLFFLSLVAIFIAGGWMINHIFLAMPLIYLSYILLSFIDYFRSSRRWRRSAAKK
jgi:CDP-diacylglycerol---serine O-phosphatidyltransferase